MDCLKEAMGQKEGMIAFRRELHQYPELSMQEFETTDRIERELNKLGLKCTRFKPTGLMTDIRGNGPGKTVALRADIDALPMAEETGLPFASKHEGVMHACGHDVHAAMLLGAARVLVNHTDEFKGTIRLLFQPAEEVGIGAQTIIDQGAAEGVDYFFGLHVKEFTECGTIGGRSGPQMGGAEEFRIRIAGNAHHAGMPHLGGGVDATVVACEIVLALQTVVSRRIDPLEGAVISIGTFHSGVRNTVISGEAVLEGSMRYQSEAVRILIKEQMHNLSEGIAKAHGATAEVSFGQNIPPVINDDYVARVAFRAAEKVTGNPKKVVRLRGTMGAEDFGSYSKCGKSCFLTVGVDGHYPGHSPKLEINEDAMPYGSAMLMQTALDLLNSEESA